MTYFASKLKYVYNSTRNEKFKKDAKFSKLFFFFLQRGTNLKIKYL